MNLFIIYGRGKSVLEIGDVISIRLRVLLSNANKTRVPAQVWSGLIDRGA